MNDTEHEDPTPDESTPDVAPFECSVLLAMRPNGGGVQIIPQPQNQNNRRGCSMPDARMMAHEALARMSAQDVVDVMAQAAATQEEAMVRQHIADNGKDHGVVGNIRDILSRRRHH